MAIKTTSAPTMPGAPRRFGRNTLLAAIGGTVILTSALTGAVVLMRRDSSAPAASPAVGDAAIQPSFTNAVAPAISYHGPQTVYVVGSEDQATMIWAGLRDATSIRSAAGEPPLPETESVVVAASDNEAATVVSAINEANVIRATNGLPAYTVVDLRGR